MSGRDGGESKLEKARDLKVKIISEDDLLQMIATRPGDNETPKKIPTPTSQPPPPPSPVKSKPTTSEYYCRCKIKLKLVYLLHLHHK